MDTDAEAKPRVVVAEDEAIIRLDIVETLTEGGFDVVGQAGDGARAVELAIELKPDLLLTDIKMPGTDGLQAAEAMAELSCSPIYRSEKKYVISMMATSLCPGLTKFREVNGWTVYVKSGK
jgi:CheY-like chemotaxis protein